MKEEGEKFLIQTFLSADREVILTGYMKKHAKPSVGMHFGQR